MLNIYHIIIAFQAQTRDSRVQLAETPREAVALAMLSVHEGERVYVFEGAAMKAIYRFDPKGTLRLSDNLLDPPW